MLAVVESGHALGLNAELIIMDKLDSLALERIGYYLDNVDLRNFTEVIDIRYIPSIKKRLRTCDFWWCGYVAKDLAKLHKHNRNNHNRIQCTYCLPYTFHCNGLYHYRQHLNCCHDTRKGNICSNCRREYWWKSSLNRHNKYCK